MSNLRPYKTVTDEEELAPDEYVVEELIDRRVIKGERSYLAKYLGFPRNQAEWTSRTELARRCEDLIDEYDATHPISKRGKKAALRPCVRLSTAQRSPRIPPLYPTIRARDQSRDQIHLLNRRCKHQRTTPSRISLR